MTIFEWFWVASAIVVIIAEIVGLIIYREETWEQTKELIRDDEIDVLIFALLIAAATFMLVIAASPLIIALALFSMFVKGVATIIKDRLDD